MVTGLGKEGKSESKRDFATLSRPHRAEIQKSVLSQQVSKTTCPLRVLLKIPELAAPSTVNSARSPWIFNSDGMSSPSLLSSWHLLRPCYISLSHILASWLSTTSSNFLIRSGSKARAKRTNRERCEIYVHIPATCLYQHSATRAANVRAVFDSTGQARMVAKVQGRSDTGALATRSTRSGLAAEAGRLCLG